MRVILPKLSIIPEQYQARMRKIEEFSVPLGWRQQYCGLETLREKGIVYYFIDNEYYFKRPSIYGHFDDAERIAFFSKAVLESLQYIPNFEPDIIHCNDWHTALVPVFLREHYMQLPLYNQIKIILSIHNLKYQGIFSNSVLSDVLGLAEYKNAADQLAWGEDAVNFMQAGLLYSDRLTTVSPTYAEEICTPWYGEQLEDIFQKRYSILSGILNGINQYKNSPGRDPYLYKNYNATTFKKLKPLNKAALQKELGLARKADTPLIAMVGRLTEQKGLDLILEVLEDLLKEDVQIAILGIGDAIYEESFLDYQERMPKKICAKITFDLTLSSKFYAGADLFLMPSKFEPCGLSHMFAMRYGTIPIVRETGGLKDSVIPYNPLDETGDGFCFANYNAQEMLSTIKNALNIYQTQKKSWDALIKRAMNKDFSWKNSAKKYVQLYEELANQEEIL